MTDKEIIIDGVDVSECEFYTTMEDCVGIHDLCEQLDDYCSIKKDCYYKQLKQLEQENAELKALCDTYRTCYQAKHNDIDGKLFKYRKTLQEIEEIISRTDSQHPPSVANMVSIIRHKLYELTKAESEG